jgi:hypothetical protein
MLLSMLLLLLLLLLHQSPCERQLHTKSAAVSQAVYAMSFLVSYGDVRCEMWSTKDWSILVLLPHSPLPPCNKTKLTTTQTQTLSFLPTQNSFKQHKQRSQTSEIHRNLSQSQPEILDLCFLLDKLFVPTTRGKEGGGGEEGVCKNTLFSNPSKSENPLNFPQTPPHRLQTQTTPKP